MKSIHPVYICDRLLGSPDLGIYVGRRGELQTLRGFLKYDPTGINPNTQKFPTLIPWET